MAEEIIMKLEEPAVRQPVSEKEFKEIYILDQVTNAREIGASDSIYFNYCPFDKSTGERLLGDQREVRLSFWEVVEAIPDAKAAFAAVAKVLPQLIVYQRQKEEAANNPPVN